MSLGTWDPEGAVAAQEGGADRVELIVLDVEQHDVTQILETGEMGERAPDLACADQGYLVTGHG